MTKLEDFVSYAKSLPPEELRILEWRLKDLMNDDKEDSLLTPEQEAATLAILANPNRELVPEGEVEAIFAKYRK